MPNDVELTARPAATAIPLPSTAPITAGETIYQGDVADDSDDVMFMPSSSDDDIMPLASAARRRLGLLAEYDFRQLFIADSGSQLGTQVPLRPMRPLPTCETAATAACEPANV
jgi:hypothetical protein